MYHNITFVPRMADADRESMLSLEGVLNMFENAADSHTSHVGWNIIEGSRNGLAWVLAEWRVRIMRRPSATERLKVTTWVTGKLPLSSSLREFIVTDEAGNEIIAAEARSALLDTAASRLTRITEEMMEPFGPEERTALEPAGRVHAPKEYSSETVIHLRRSDIDFNGHVHNTRYVQLAMQALPEQVYRDGRWSEMRISYLKPVKESDAVCGRYVSCDGEHIVGIFSEDVLCTVVRLR